MKITPVDMQGADDVSRGHAHVGHTIRDFILMVLAVIIIGSGIMYVSDLIAFSLPDKYERKLKTSTKKIFSSQPSNSPTVPTKTFSNAKNIFQKLLSQNIHRDLDYELIEIESTMPNAFALPGGTVGVTSSILDMIESNIGLAVVLGHELGHHFYRHVLRRLSKGISFNIIKSIIFGNGDFAGHADQAFYLVQLSFSRQQELEADDFGVRLVYKIFGTAIGATEFFEKMQEFEDKLDTSDDDTQRYNSLFRTHPYPNERIKKINSLIEKLDHQKNS